MGLYTKRILKTGLVVNISPEQCSVMLCIVLVTWHFNVQVHFAL